MVKTQGNPAACQKKRSMAFRFRSRPTARNFTATWQPVRSTATTGPVPAIQGSDLKLVEAGHYRRRKGAL